MTTVNQSVSNGSPAARPPGDLAAALRALAVAGFSLLTVLMTYVVFVRTTTGQRLDQLAIQHLARSEATRSTVATLLREVTVTSIVIVLGTCVAIAAIRRRGVLGLSAVVLVVGANLSTQVLKHLIFTRPNLGYGTANTLPSGHMTVVASLVLAALLVVPHTGRWVVGLAGSISIAVTGVGTVVANWHRPSDVVGALAVTLAWGALVLAAVSWRYGGPEPTGRAPRAHPAALALGLAVAAGLFVALGVRPNGNSHDLLVHVVIMCGLALCGALVVGLYARMVDTRVT